MPEKVKKQRRVRIITRNQRGKTKPRRQDVKTAHSHDIAILQLMLSAKRDWMNFCRLSSNCHAAAVSTIEMLELIGTN